MLRPVLRLVRDYRAGMLADWPDAYTGAAVDAVYFVLEQADAATEHVMEQT